MKRIIALVFVFVLMLSMAGCGNSNNQYTSKITTSNSPHSITFEIDENKINVSGTFKTDLHKYLLVFFDKDNSDDCKIKVVNRSFNGTFELPNKKNMLVELYGGEEEFGNFESIILDYIKVEQVGDKWCFVKSPVLENNKTIFNEKKNSADYIGQTEQIQSEDSEIIELSKSITLGINDDYDEDTLKRLFYEGHPCMIRAAADSGEPARWLPVMYMDDDGGVVWNPYSEEHFLVQFSGISRICCFTIINREHAG